MNAIKLFSVISLIIVMSALPGADDAKGRVEIYLNELKLTINHGDIDNLMKLTLEVIPDEASVQKIFPRLDKESVEALTPSLEQIETIKNSRDKVLAGTKRMIDEIGPMTKFEIVEVKKEESSESEKKMHAFLDDGASAFKIRIVHEKRTTGSSYFIVHGEKILRFPEMQLNRLFRSLDEAP